MSLRIETAPSRWRRGITEAQAWRVGHDRLAEIAAWCGGHTWAGSVVVPVEPGEELAARPGDWIVRYVTGELAVWQDAAFRRVWRPVIA